MQNAIPYTLLAPIEQSLEDMTAEAGKFLHRNPAPTQFSMSGFVPPFKDSELIEQIGNDTLLFAIKTTKRDLSSAVINEETSRHVQEREEQEGRTLVRSERQEIKNAVVATLLPKAFFKHSVVRMLVTPKRIFVDCTSPKKAEDVALYFLRAILGSLKVAPLATKNPVSVEMTGWLVDVAEHGPAALPFDDFFISDKMLKLGSPSEDTTYTLKGVDPADDNVKDILDDNNRVIEMQLRQPQVAEFRLNDCLHLRAIKWSEAVNDKVTQDIGEDDHALTRSRATWTLFDAAIRENYDRLIKACGGEVEHEKTEDQKLAEASLAGAERQNDDEQDEGDALL